MIKEFRVSSFKLMEIWNFSKRLFLNYFFLGAIVEKTVSHILCACSLVLFMASLFFMDYLLRMSSYLYLIKIYAHFTILDRISKGSEQMENSTGQFYTAHLTVNANKKKLSSHKQNFHKFSTPANHENYSKLSFEFPL